jgi:hypothetical protein
MIEKLFNLFRPKPTPEPRALSIQELARGNSDIVTGYKLSVTMSPSTPLKYLNRHGERRTSIPEEEKLANSPYLVWLPEVSDEFAFLERGATMSSAVGYIPRDGGDFLPFLVELRKVVERPRALPLSELDDAHSRAAEMPRISCGYGYGHDADFNLIKYAKETGRENYYQIVSRGDPEWAFEFVLQELASCPHNGLTLGHVKELHQRGFGSILEIVEAPDEVLLSLKGIEKKKLERIRANRPK